MNDKVYFSNIMIITLSVLALLVCASTLTAQPYPSSAVIQEISLDWNSHIKLAPGSDNFQVTWADDNHQYAAWGDGGGFGGTNSDGRVKLGVARIEGAWDNYTGHNVWGGKSPENPKQFDGKSWGMICIKGVLYMWVGPQPNPHMDEARLAKSTDHGATWTRADWAYKFNDKIVLPTFLNYGKNYAGARDNYVYCYSPNPKWGPSKTSGTNGFDVHKPGEIFLWRALKTDLMDSSAYEYFTGLDAGGNPQWGTLAQKAPVFEDANGVGWNLSVSYNAGLGRYILCTEHDQSTKGKLGIFDAPEPWGPWTTVEYWTDPYFGEGQIKASAFFMNFSNKWLSTDGKDFTLVFTGTSSNDAWNTIRGSFTVAPTVGLKPVKLGHAGNGLKVFPNPARNVVNFKIRNVECGMRNCRIEIYNLGGRLLNSAFHIPHSACISHDIRTCNSGEYIASVSIGDRKYLQSFTILH